MNGSVIGEPTNVEWGRTAFEDNGGGAGDPQAKTSRQKIRVGGREFDCLVVQVAGAGTSWIPMSGDAPTFPGLIKTADPAGIVTLELERIE